MVARRLCPIRGERATLRGANRERYVCAAYVARGFSLGYVCVGSIAVTQAADARDGDS